MASVLAGGHWATKVARLALLEKDVLVPTYVTTFPWVG